MLSGILGRSKPTPPPAQPTKATPKDIFEACEKGDLEAVKSFHKNGVDINAQTSSGWLPIHTACKVGNLNVVKYLVENGSEVNRLTHKVAPYSPLDLACSYFHDKVARYLLNHGALPNQNLFKGLTVLHSLNGEKTAKCAQALIHGGALVGCKDDFGRTPLHYSKSRVISELLIDAGCSSYSKDNKGNTPGELTILSNGYNNLYEMEKNDTEEWRKVELQERNAEGKIIENSEKIYSFENKTSDFYNVEESMAKFRGKALAVVALALPIAIKTTFMHIVQIISDIALGVWNSIKAFSKDQWAESLKKIALSLVWDAPAAIVTRIYRAIRAPLFATAMLFTALYTAYTPIEGRSLLNKIEEMAGEAGLLELAGMKKVGNVATSEINGYARFYLTEWDPK
jgi:ankyrin repeat protein